MRKADTGRIILLAALLLAAFSTGFYFGRSSVPFEVSVQTRLPVSRQQAETGAQTAAQTETPAQEQAAPVNLNTATLEELETLPGIGEVLAGRILAYRDRYGKFTAAEQLLDVEGIGEATFEKLKDQITVGDGS